MSEAVDVEALQAELAYLRTQVRRYEDARRAAIDAEDRAFAMGAEAFRAALLQEVAGNVPLAFEAAVRRLARPTR